MTEETTTDTENTFSTELLSSGYVIPPIGVTVEQQPDGGKILRIEVQEHVSVADVLTMATALIEQVFEK